MNNLFAQSIGQRAFESITGLQKHFPVLNKYEQDGPIVFGFLPYFPGAKNAHGVIRHGGVGLHFRKNRHHDLVAGGAFKVFQFRVKLLGRAGIHHMGVVIEISVRRGRNDFRAKTSQTAKPDENETPILHGGYGLAGAGPGLELSKLNCTLGATSEPGVAAKNGFS
jgi:hypothetical protein